MTLSQGTGANANSTLIQSGGELLALLQGVQVSTVSQNVFVTVWGKKEAGFLEKPHFWILGDRATEVKSG